ncbi:hypothetical protein Plec18167_008503 [Paecilomyces lecythidis]|uniref:Phosphatidate phosphatase APP1 catalytic domain-containing protein n=1 Tax=Paecilomyces lecythidis TaxID=3004212 RepID=A0ABR3WVP6_9EURO
MAQYNSAGSWGGEREPGARRKKVYGYFKAANELRQAYTAQLMRGSTQDYDYDEGTRVPGAFPDVDIARSGDEEMLIFPSYARRHVRKKPEVRANRPQESAFGDESDMYQSGEEMQYWKEEWDTYEDKHAIVDVDVRGWIYMPQRGPLTRKHRLLIALARRLSGVPAPTPANSRESSQPPPLADKAAQPSTRQEEDLVNKEAQSIIKQAEGDADDAWRGAASDERPGRESGRSSSTVTIPSMAKDELVKANKYLMERMRPFLATPMVGVPVTVFFFNDEQSQSRNVVTNESGHFSLKAALPFVPTEIRVLASDKLSVSKPVQLTEPKGVSLISDIDDTIKHSAIASGAREIFRNTFVRELHELTVEGVREWYSKLASMGVTMHYVSNSPWQLYPLLETYFKLAGLPPGSFHLKQYSGMLQGIFEPTAERKRGSLEKILGDFPERKFILVGDSGEADLEVYTDIVLAYPGRILGIFIRDVTTPAQKRFFDKSVDDIETGAKRSRSTPQLVDHFDAAENRPALPPRRIPSEPNVKDAGNADLIDLSEPEPANNSSDAASSTNSKPPPVKPSKPSTLRNISTDSGPSLSNEQETRPSPVEDLRRKPVPVPPEKPRKLSTSRGTQPEQRPQLPIRPGQQGKPPVPSRSIKSSEQEQPGGYASNVRNAVSDAYENLPLPNLRRPATTAETNSAQQARPKQPPPVPPPRRGTAATTAATPTKSSTTPQPTRPTPERLPSAFSAAAQYASERLNWSSNPASLAKASVSTPNFGRTNNTSSDYEDPDGYFPPAPLPNKREELWRRRLERAKSILDREGVVLGTWRVGSDVQDVCMWLAEEAQKAMQEENNSSRKT